MSFIGGALLSRTEKDIHKISFAGGHTSFLVCRKVCEKILGGHDHVTRVTWLTLTIMKNAKMKKNANKFIIFGWIYMKLWLIRDLYELKANIHSRRCFNNEKLFGHVINLSQITCKKLTITYLSNRLWMIFKISEMAYSIAMNWFMYSPRDFGDNWSRDWRSRDLSYITCIKRILMWFALEFWQRIYWVYSFTMIQVSYTKCSDI